MAELGIGEKIGSGWAWDIEWRGGCLTLDLFYNLVTRWQRFVCWRFLINFT